MPKLRDADVRLFVEALERGPSAAVEDTARSLGERELDADRVASSLERALHGYLGVEVRCRVQDAAAAPAAAAQAGALWFASPALPTWQLAFDAPLAALLSDLVIGGEGSGGRTAPRTRTAALLEPLALRFAAAFADASGLTPPASLKVASEVPVDAHPAAGIIECGSRSGHWVLVAPVSAVARVEPGAASGAEARSGFKETAAASPSGIVHAHAPPQAEEWPPQADERPSLVAPRERLLTARAAGDSRSALAQAVEGGCAQLAEITHRSATAQSIDVSSVENPALQRGDLKLALIAGGQGSLVLCADRQAVAVIAEAAAGGQLPPEQEHGCVVIDAAEAVLRAAMRGFAERLPGLASGPQRFVRLAEGAMLARSPHYAVTSPVRLDGQTATLQWILPKWMADSGEFRLPDSRAPE